MTKRSFVPRRTRARKRALELIVGGVVPVAVRRVTRFTTLHPLRVCLWRSTYLPTSDCAAETVAENRPRPVFLSTTLGRTTTLTGMLFADFQFAWKRVSSVGLAAYVFESYGEHGDPHSFPKAPS